MIKHFINSNKNIECIKSIRVIIQAKLITKTHIYMHIYISYLIYLPYYFMLKIFTAYKLIYKIVDFIFLINFWKLEEGNNIFPSYPIFFSKFLFFLNQNCKNF